MIVTRVCGDCGARKRVIEDTGPRSSLGTRCSCGARMGLVLFDSETEYEAGSLLRTAKRSDNEH